MRAPPAFDNRDDLIYNDRYMKKCSILKFVTAVAACAATLIAVFSAGCFLFKSDVLDTPYLEKYGSIYSWNEVDGANKYLVRTGGESVYTTECEIRVTNPEAGGQLSVTALNVVNGEVKAKSEAALVEFTAIPEGGANYAEYGDDDREGVTIPGSVEKAVFKGDEYGYFNGVKIAMRSRPLIIELHDVKLYDLRLEEGSVNRAEACVILRSLGESGNELRGNEGEMGARGETGGGLLNAGGVGGKGGDGTPGASLGHVVIEGNANLDCFGGMGGMGGKGGSPGWGNTKAGDGGRGGNGGTGFIAERVLLCTSGEFSCLGGSPGEGGHAGSGSLGDNGDPGKPGSAGVDFKGEKIIKDLLAVTLDGNIKNEDSVPDGSDGDNDNVNSGLAGVYKFYAASNGEETFGIGDALPDGEVLTSDFATLTLNADGTFELVSKGETKSGTWESGGNLVVLTDENGNLVSARLNDTVLELRQGDYTLSFRK